jgi:hypothetical protein
MEMSRQSTYTEWHGEMICLGLSEGHSLLSICEALGVPHATARKWEAEIPAHGANVARAREAGCHALAEQALEIANTPHLGEVRTTKADGAVEIRQEDMTNHRRLQIDTRKWLIAKWLPKVYGDKQQIEHSGGISLAEVLREAKAKRKGEP